MNGEPDDDRFETTVHDLTKRLVQKTAAPAVRRRCRRGFAFPRKQVDYPPVTLIWRATAGRWWRRSMMKSWPLGLRPIASSIAAMSRSLASDARDGLRKSAASSWPRHI